MWAALPFFCRRKRIPADQNAVRHRLFGGDVPAGVGRFSEYSSRFLWLHFYIADACGSNYKNIIFGDVALP